MPSPTQCFFRLTLPAGTILLGCAVLAGCGSAPTSAAATSTTTTTPLTVSGHVKSGLVPVSGSTVRLYVAGSTGNASAARSLLSIPATGVDYVTTDTAGAFGFSGDFQCASTDQVYVVATGGNPGLAAGTNNSALVMVDAIGSCSNLAAANYTILVNEVTTVAAAWALAPFITSATALGASSTNSTGLANAFLNAQLLADPTLGTSPGSALLSNETIEAAKVNALANALALCVNAPSACASLFAAATPSGGAQPSDTLVAALSIVKHPAQNVAAVYAAANAAPVFSAALTRAPHDWTMSLTVSGAGLNSPTQLAVDTLGDVWVANYVNSISAVSPQGKPLSPAATTGVANSGGFANGVLTEIYGLAVDTNNNVWATYEESPYHNGTFGSVVSLNGQTSGNTLGSVIANKTTSGGNGSNYFYDNSIDYPESLASDSNGNILIGSYANGAATIYTSAGVPALSGYVNGSPVYATGLGSGYAAFPVAISGDGNGGVWLANVGDNTVTHADAFGNIVSHPACCNKANGIATDKLGNAWVANYQSSSVSEVSPYCDATGAGINPNCGASIPVPSAGVVTIAGSAQVSSTSSCSLAGTPIAQCPAADTTTTTTSVSTGGVSYPAGLSIDAAQNIFVANYRGSSFSEIAGNGTSSPGAGISPNSTTVTVVTGSSTTSTTSSGGYGLDAGLTLPFDIAPDLSGNVWVSDFGANHLVMFFGIAAPTATPARPIPTAP